MGIRFRCHLCHTELNVKDHQAGKRGRCPACHGSFRIPLADADFSLSPADRPQVADSPAGERGLAESPTPATAQPAARQPSTLQSAAATAADVATKQLAAPFAPDTRLPQAIEESLAASWYVRPTSGGQYGPASAQVVGQWLLENRIGADALVWREDWPEWLSASLAFPEHFQSPPVTTVPGGIPSPGRSLPPVKTPYPNVPAVPSVPIVPKETAGPSGPILQASGLSLGQKSRDLRRRRRHRNYMILVVGLIVAFLLLLAGLVAVLWLQNSRTSSWLFPAPANETLAPGRPSSEIKSRVEIGLVET